MRKLSLDYQAEREKRDENEREQKMTERETKRG